MDDHRLISVDLTFLPGTHPHKNSILVSFTLQYLQWNKSNDAFQWRVCLELFIVWDIYILMKFDWKLSLSYWRTALYGSRVGIYRAKFDFIRCTRWFESNTAAHRCRNVYYLLQYQSLGTHITISGKGGKEEQNVQHKTIFIFTWCMRVNSTPMCTRGADKIHSPRLEDTFVRERQVHAGRAIKS